jgi:SAM-dependent methyltransferase
MSQPDFVQDDCYAEHFKSYVPVFSKLLGVNPAVLEITKGSQVVEVGCGFGDQLEFLRQHGYSGLTGIEPDATCREGAKARGFDVREGTMNETHLADGFADAVIVNNVFHHIADYGEATLELARILKPSGMLCFLEPLNTTLRSAMDFVTFKTPLRKCVPTIESRYQVMRLEVETGLYPKFLREQSDFHAALDKHFARGWYRRGYFFQFGKYLKK